MLRFGVGAIPIRGCVSNIGNEGGRFSGAFAACAFSFP